MYSKEIGGSKNWDYRFTWIRDAAFTVYAFMRIGLNDEATKFMKWIEKRCRDLVMMLIVIFSFYCFLIANLFG